jgi:hypothetical protein
MPGPARAGALLYAKPTYSGPGFVVRNATDAEGNVFQMREWRSNAAA